MLGHRGPDIAGLTQLAPERRWLAAVAVAVQEVTAPVPAEQGADRLAPQAIVVVPGREVGGHRASADPPRLRRPVLLPQCPAEQLADRGLRYLLDQLQVNGLLVAGQADVAAVLLDLPERRLGARKGRNAPHH